MPGGESAGGFGDAVQSFFISAKDPVGGCIVGVGPVLQIPTATDDAFKSRQRGVVPTAVALRRQNGWTDGGLFNHIRGIVALSDPEKVNATFQQPFLGCTTPDAWTFSLNSESRHNRDSEDWTVPVNTGVSKLIKRGKQPISIQGGCRHYVETPDGGPDWGLRCVVTVLFPAVTGWAWLYPGWRSRCAALVGCDVSKPGCRV